MEVKEAAIQKLKFFILWFFPLGLWSCFFWTGGWRKREWIPPKELLGKRRINLKVVCAQIPLPTALSYGFSKGQESVSTPVICPRGWMKQICCKNSQSQLFLLLSIACLHGRKYNSSPFEGKTISGRHSPNLSVTLKNNDKLYASKRGVLYKCHVVLYIWSETFIEYSTELCMIS